MRNLRGLVPYLGRYKGAISLGLLTLALMGFVGAIVPLATGIITDTLAGSGRPLENCPRCDRRLPAQLAEQHRAALSSE